MRHFAFGVLTPRATKGDARPLWKPHLVVPAQGAGNSLLNRGRSYSGAVQASMARCLPAADQHPREPIITTRAGAVDWLHSGIAGWHSQENPDVAVTAGASAA